MTGRSVSTFAALAPSCLKPDVDRALDPAGVPLVGLAHVDDLGAVVNQRVLRLLGRNLEAGGVKA